MMADDLIDNEAQEFFGEIGVELCVARQLTQPFDLPFLASGIARGEF